MAGRAVVPPPTPRASDDSTAGAHQAIREVHRGRRHRPPRPARTVVRVPRSQRCREDDERLRMIAGFCVRARHGPHRRVDISTDPIAAKAKLGFIPDRPSSTRSSRGIDFLRFVAGLFEQSGPQVRASLPRVAGAVRSRAVRDESSRATATVRQKLIISSAFVHRPEVIVVDDRWSVSIRGRAHPQDSFASTRRRGNTI